MVSAAHRLLSVAGFALGLAVSIPAREIAGYQIGDTVEADIVAPVALKVVDPEATRVLKEKAALQVPAIFRFDATAAAAVEADFVAAFDQTRSNFLRRLQGRFVPQSLGELALADPIFQHVLGAMLEQRKTVPLSTNLAELWARGDSGAMVRTSVVARLREAMQEPIRPDFMPAGFKLSRSLRFVTVTNRDQAITLEEAGRAERLTPRANLLVLSRVRKEFLNTFPPEEDVLARAAAAMLRANWLPEAELTKQARARHTEPLLVAEDYPAGQVIARRGEVVNAKIKAALDQLRERTALVRLQAQVAEGKNTTARMRRQHQWLWAGLTLAVLVLIPVGWRLARARRSPSLLPARMAGDRTQAAVIACPACEENIAVPADALEAAQATAGEWQRRARAAELRAERAHAALRAGLLPRLADWLRLTFVQGLVAQRSQLLEAQRCAAAEMTELERRLDELHTPLQERLRAYEQRIVELEKTLAAKGEENRQLLRARIQLTRQQLEAERVRCRVELN